MKYPQIKVIFDRRKTASKTKRASVEISITLNGKRKILSTGVLLHKNQWKDGVGVVNSYDCIQQNELINSLILRIKDYVASLAKQGQPFTFEGLNAMQKADDTTDETFLDFMERTMMSRSDVRESTRKTQHQAVNALRAFGKIVTFADLTLKNIMAYDQWLHEKGLRQQTIARRHKINKTYIHKAMTLGIIDKDPYSGFKVEVGRAAMRKYLTADELVMIERAEPKTDSISNVRDLFMFQCYTGLSYAELCNFDASKIVKRKGRHIVAGQRQKTGESYYIVILPKAMEILRKHQMRLPLMTMQQYNMRLKILADTAGLDKHITSHMARHTFAVTALNAGIPIEVLAKMMGHTDIKTTQIYAKILNTQVEEEFDKLI